MEASATGLIERARQRGWYHTLELRPGEWTDGWFDLRPAIKHYGLPEDMSGMRALDVGTWDGFWAFEMERRGADVVAIDLDDERELDWPPRQRPETFPEEPRGAGFELAKEIRGSSVERVVLSIYDATPEELGTFDLVLCGSVLIHLRDQLRAPGFERVDRHAFFRMRAKGMRVPHVVHHAFKEVRARDRSAGPVDRALLRSAMPSYTI